MSRRWLFWPTAAAPYEANPVDFDGTNDYLTRDAGLTDAADSKLLTGSFWYKKDVNNSAQRLFVANSFDFGIQFTAGNALQIVAEDLSGNQDLNVTDTGHTDTTSWHHVMFSFDMADTGNRHVYLDGADAAPSYDTYNNDTLDFTQANWAVGATTTAGAKYNGQLADLAMWFGVYVDLSQEANRELFIVDGKPVDRTIPAAALGTPIVALGGPTDSWHTNDGSGGGFTENGALTDGTGPVEL